MAKATIQVPGLKVSTEKSSVKKLHSVVKKWAAENGYQMFKDKRDGELVAMKGAGFLTAVKQFRFTFEKEPGRVEMEIKPVLRSMGGVGSIDTKVVAGLPAAQARGHRDALLESIRRQVPDVEIEKITSEVAGYHIWIALMLMTVPAFLIGALLFYIFTQIFS